jgi:hypothetical protein
MRVRKTVITLVAALLIAAAYLVWERIKFDRDGWLTDYDQLRTHVSRNYANLLWAIEHRDIDPAALHQATLQKLQDARTDRAARAAIASFVSAFQDGHFRIARTRLSDRLESLFSSEADEVAGGTPADKACAALGFSDETEGLAFENSGMRLLATPDNSFAAGTFQVGDKTAGMLRIPIFDQRRYLPACERAWRAHVGERACDGGCVRTFVDAVVPNQLLSELAAQVRALNEADAQLLVVDVTGNGGGTDWVEPAARMVAGKSLGCAQVSFIKGPHWMKTFSGITAKIDEDLAASHNPGDVALLQVARRRAQDFADRASATCTLDALWTKAEAPACSNLVEDPSHTACGLMGPLPKDSLSRATSRDALFHGLAFDYDEGVFSGPVAVLIDDGTASAAEYFAAILADNEAATLIGERTYGVGCGYTSGGVSVLLTHSALRIMMPDCQRLRRDGTNEMAGISPHIAFDWQEAGSDAERWAKLTAALAPLMAAE